MLFSVNNPYATFGDLFYLLSLSFFQVGIIIALKGVGYRLSKSYILFLPFVQIVGILSANLLLSKEVGIHGMLGLSYIVLGLTNTLLGIAFLFKSWDMLYGAFRNSFGLIVIATITLLFADSIYLLQTAQESWVPGGLSDILYMLSYALFGLGTVVLGERFYMAYNEPISVYFSYESLI
jgi:hypothetical protein